MLATLGAYKILGCNGSSNDDLIVAALERAVMDRMDIINLSMGEPNGWPDSMVARAISKVKSFGIMVTVSGGNENIQGLFSANYVAEGPSALSVASYINTRVLLSYFIIPMLPTYQFREFPNFFFWVLGQCESAELVIDASFSLSLTSQ